MLEYLADNVAGQPTAIVVTVRSDTLSPDLSAVRDLAARRMAVLVELARLCPDDVTAMACECLGVASVGADIRAFLDRAGDCRSWSRSWWRPLPGMESWSNVRAAGL